jgi:hypothetical protein
LSNPVEDDAFAIVFTCRFSGAIFGLDGNLERDRMAPAELFDLGEVQIVEIVESSRCSFLVSCEMGDAAIGIHHKTTSPHRFRRGLAPPRRLVEPYLCLAR